MADNLVNDPGFESGGFAGWTVNGNIGSDIGVDSYSDDVHSGSYGVYAGNSNTSTLSQVIPTQAGSSYSVSFYLNVYQADATNGAFSATFGGQTVTFLSEPTETDGFVRYSASITATSNASNLQFQFSDPGGYFGLDDVDVEQTPVCYVAGTRIATARGSVPVEALRVGDLAVTSTGQLRPIRWIGHRTVDCRAHRDRRAVWPVRIAAHAFGASRPARDLYVSPGHAIGCEAAGAEVLIPAIRLLNGSTVALCPVDSVSYWHVELDSHDVLLAEGLPAESYLDMGNRRFFATADAVSLFGVPDGVPPSHADFCRPFVDGGGLLDDVRETLAAHARAMGWTQTREVDLVFEVDGSAVAGSRRDGAYEFPLPSAARSVRLRSDGFVPFDIYGEGDARRLGVNIVSLQVRDGQGASHPVCLDDPRLAAGFHPAERRGSRTCRWTSGDAVLDPALWDGLTGSLVLSIDLDLSSLRACTPPQGRSGGPETLRRAG